MYRTVMLRIGRSFSATALGLLLTACAEGQAGQGSKTTLEASSGSNLQVELVDRGAAPEIENQGWLNVDQPLRLRELKDNVVLLEFWTFG